MSESYTSAAIRGCGLVKGSKEAKAYMAHLRSLRGKKKKGSMHGSGILDDMIRNRRILDYTINDMRRDYPNKILKNGVSGKGIAGTAISTYLKLLARCGKDWWNESHAQQDEIKRLEQQIKQRRGGGRFDDMRKAGKILREGMRQKILSAKKGGKFELGDIRDFLAGPLGWVRMGMRKSRQKKIDALKAELER